MSRRRRSSTPQQKSALGLSHLETAKNTIARRMQRAVAALTDYGVSVEKTIAMLFKDDDIAKARAAKGIVKPDYICKQYAVAHECVLTIDYSKAITLPIDPERLYIQPDRAGPLFRFIEEVRAIYCQYEECYACLKWLDLNASAGAIRYYWPPAMQLCSDSPALLGMHEVPTRYLEPPRISDHLQQLRDTSATMAASVLIPETVKPRLRNSMWLTFNSQTVQHPEDVSGLAKFVTQTQTFNI